MKIKRAVIIMKGGSGRRVLGLDLLKRLILNAEEAGLKEFWLFHPDRREAEREMVVLSGDKRIFDRNITFRIISSGDFEKLYDPGSGDFFLLLQDNLVLAPELLKNLLETKSLPEAEIVLIGCQYSSGEICPASGLVLARGRALPSILSRLESPEAELMDVTGSDTGLSVSRMQVQSRFCVEVRNKAELKRAEKLLLQTGRKPTDGFISRNINRRVSLFLTRYLLKLDVTPMQISVVTFLIGLTSVIFIAMGRKWLIPGAILFELASVIDGCDGENARLTYRVTRLGGAFDVTADAITFVSFFAALPIGLYRTTGDQLWLYLGGLALFSMAAFYVQLIAYARKTGIGRNIIAVVKEVEASVNDPDFQNWYDKLAARLAFIYRRDFFATAAFVLIAAGQASLTMFLVTVLASLEALYFASFSRRRLNKRNSDELQPTRA